MKQTQTRAWSRAGDEAVAYSLVRRTCSGSHSGEWRGRGVLSCAREKAMAVAITCTWAAPDAGQRENTETVAKQKQPSRPRYHARGVRPVDHVSTNY